MTNTDAHAFDVFNDDGTTDALLICDHASNAMPAEMNRLGLAPWALSRHIAWDIGAALVTRALADRLDACAVLSGFSRLIVDPNRPLDHEHSMRTVSDEITVPGNQSIGRADAAQRAKTFFVPYHREIERRIAALRARTVPVLISIHSFTPIMNGRARPWHAAILHGDDDRLVGPVLTAFADRHPALVVGDNEPYTGYSHESYSVLYHAERNGLPNITFEIRQDLIDSPRGAALWAELLATVLAAPLADPAVRQLLGEG